MPPPPPLPSLRRAGSRSDGRGGGSSSDGDLPFAARPPSDPRPRGSPGDSAGAMRSTRRRSCGSSPREGCDWGWDCHLDCEVPFWCLTGCSGFRSVAGGTHRGARPLSHTDVDRSLGGGSRSTTRSCCYSQRRGIQDSSPGRRWKEMGGAVDSPGVASNGEIGTHCTQGTGSNRIPEVGTKWVSIPRSLPISIATSGETHVSTSMANPLRRLICLFTKWVIKLACCCHCNSALIKTLAKCNNDCCYQESPYMAQCSYTP